MEQFPHLRFVQKVIGKPRYFPVVSPNERSEQNKKNREKHGSGLFGRTSGLSQEWERDLSEREKEGLPPLNKDVIPVFLQINPDLITNIFELENLGIEIISEEDEGFIIGASLDRLRTLNEKIRGFIGKEHGTGIIADLWEIIEGKNWKPEHILSEELYRKWHQIRDEEIFQLEVSVAFDKPIGKEPDRSKKGGLKRLETYRKKQEARDESMWQRQDQFDKFIHYYGRRISEIIELEDSFACEVEISGKGLKDLVYSYPFLFDVSEKEKIENLETRVEEAQSLDFEIIPPETDDQEVGVIDSGIMEGHKYISPAIKPERSKSYIDGDGSTADHVLGGGHGTKVAGAVLYPDGISGLSGPYQLPCFIRNIRILNGENQLINEFPASLMNKIVKENDDCKIFNLSVNSNVPCRTKHMSSWAAMIDNLIHLENLLFVVSSGNISQDYIRYSLDKGAGFPDYLLDPFCRIANPAQSCFALTVGSVNPEPFEDDNWKSLGSSGDISPFSRAGFGIWDEIKPDVVETGGGLVASKYRPVLVRENQYTSPELLHSTLHGGTAYGRGSVGTSFAAPKVSHIVAQLKKLYPEENVNLLRALVVQGARLPNDYFENPTPKSIRFMGYGLPSLERVMRNSEQRITFYNTNGIKAEEGHVYELKIPEELRSQANEYDILIEITLAFTARIRRTRQKTKSYLSTWLDWTTSRIDEPFDRFRDYVISSIEGEEKFYDSDERKMYEVYPWKIKSKSDGGVKGITRSNSTIQKDWAVIKSFQLPREISIAVRAHKGWDKNAEAIPYALTVSLEVLNVKVPIYEQIRIENEIEIPVQV
ncbi:MAG: S8 family peptidase [Mangrovibacterium sp.]